jgi:hypothetical protein
MNGGSGWQIVMVHKCESIYRLYISSVFAAWGLYFVLVLFPVILNFKLLTCVHERPVQGFGKLRECSVQVAVSLGVSRSSIGGSFELCNGCVNYLSLLIARHAALKLISHDSQLCNSLLNFVMSGSHDPILMLLLS